VTALPARAAQAGGAPDNGQRAGSVAAAEWACLQATAPQVSAVPPLDVWGWTVAIALPPSRVRSVLRTLGRSGGPGITRRWTCRVESSGSTGHQGVTCPGVGAWPSWGCSDRAGVAPAPTRNEAHYADPGHGLGATGRAERPGPAGPPSASPASPVRGRSAVNDAGGPGSGAWPGGAGTLEPGQVAGRDAQGRRGGFHPEYPLSGDATPRAAA